jgi:hypothetical protein
LAQLAKGEQPMGEVLTRNLLVRSLCVSLFEVEQLCRITDQTVAWDVIFHVHLSQSIIVEHGRFAVLKTVVDHWFSSHCRLPTAHSRKSQQRWPHSLLHTPSARKWRRIKEKVVTPIERTEGRNPAIDNCSVMIDYRPSAGEEIDPMAFLRTEYQNLQVCAFRE